MTQVTELLIEAKKLIDTPDKWIKGIYEWNGCYCVSGALREARKSFDYNSFWKAYELIMQEAYSVDIPKFNDAITTTHDDVMKVMDKAIKASKANKLQELIKEQKAVAEQMEKAYAIEEKARAVTLDFAVKYRELDKLIMMEKEAK